LGRDTVQGATLVRTVMAAVEQTRPMAAKQGAATPTASASTADGRAKQPHPPKRVHTVRGCNDANDRATARQQAHQRQARPKQTQKRCHGADRRRPPKVARGRAAPPPPPLQQLAALAASALAASYRALSASAAATCGDRSASDTPFHRRASSDTTAVTGAAAPSSALTASRCAAQ